MSQVVPERHQFYFATVSGASAPEVFSDKATLDNNTHDDGNNNAKPDYATQQLCPHHANKTHSLATGMLLMMTAGRSPLLNNGRTMNPVKRLLQRVAVTSGRRRGWGRFLVAFAIAVIFTGLYGVSLFVTGRYNLSSYFEVVVVDNRPYYDPERIIPRQPTCESFNRLLEGKLGLPH